MVFSKLLMEDSIRKGGAHRLFFQMAELQHCVEELCRPVAQVVMVIQVWKIAVLAVGINGCLSALSSVHWHASGSMMKKALTAHVSVVAENTGFDNPCQMSQSCRRMLDAFLPSGGGKKIGNHTEVLCILDTCTLLAIVMINSK